MVVKKRNLLKEGKKEKENEKKFICGHFISWKVFHYEFFLEWWIKCEEKVLIYCYLAFTPPKWFLKAVQREDFYVKPSTLWDLYIPIHWGQAGEYNSDERPRHFSSRAIVKNRNKPTLRNSTATVEDLRIAWSARCCLWLWCFWFSCRGPAGLESHFIYEF